MLRGDLNPPAHLRCWLLLALLCWNALPGLAWASAVLPSGPAVSDYTCALKLSECALPTNSQAYLYTGEQIDPDLGMYYLRARYYQPGLGRFWNTDSYEGRQEEPLSLHKYLYCHGNPINGTDPSGHDLVGSISAMSISIQINAANFMVTSGALAETAMFVTGITMLNSAQLLSTGIDPETGGAASGVATVCAVADFLPGGKLITRPIKGLAGKPWRDAALRIWDSLSAISRQGHQVHHRIPLEWAHIFPQMNPNRIENLKLVPETIHNGSEGVTSAWRQFKQALGGRNPTPEEVEAFARQVDQDFGAHFKSLN